MAILNQNWYNLQSTRSHPLDETSTGADDTGALIRNDILVDCNVRFPSTLGTYMYVQALTVSPGLVTVVLGVGETPDAAGVTVATVSVPKPVRSYVNLPVSALVPGVSGWLVFGPGIDTPFSGRYSTPRQSLLAPRCARMYAALPVPTIGKLGLGTSLTGVVALAAETPLRAVYVPELGTVVDGHSGEPVVTAKQAIVLALDQTLTTSVFNPLQAFLGPCGQRPESGTCPKEPIEAINGLVPDCNGNIELVFDGFTTRSVVGCDPANPEQCCGLDILTDAGLSQTCSANLPDPQREFVDACCTPQPGQSPDAYCWADPVPPIDIIIDEPVEFNYACASLPLCVDFSSCGASPHMLTLSGAFSAEQTVAPPLCGASGTSTNHYTYASTGNAINIALFKNCATDWAMNRTISAELKISSNGIDRNGGVVLNYRQVVDETSIVTTYIAVVVDVSRGRLRVLRYNGSVFTEEHYVPLQARTNFWYVVSATPVENSNGTVTLHYSAAGSNGTVSGTVTLNTYGDPVGQAGLFTRQSYTYFNRFTIA